MDGSTCSRRTGGWEQPPSLAGDPVWRFHAQPMGAGGSQLYAYDVNGDGLSDIITALEAHGFGLAWYEQYRDRADIRFRQHVIMNKERDSIRTAGRATVPKRSTDTIEGLKLDVRAEELVARLEERVAMHRAKMDAYGTQLRRLGDIGPDPEDDDVIAEMRGGGSPRHRSRPEAANSTANASRC